MPLSSMLPQSPKPSLRSKYLFTFVWLSTTLSLTLYSFHFLSIDTEWETTETCDWPKMWVVHIFTFRFLGEQRTRIAWNKHLQQTSRCAHFLVSPMKRNLGAGETTHRAKIGNHIGDRMLTKTKKSKIDALWALGNQNRFSVFSGKRKKLVFSVGVGFFPYSKKLSYF